MATLHCYLLSEHFYKTNKKWFPFFWPTTIENSFSKWCATTTVSSVTLCGRNPKLTLVSEMMGIVGSVISPEAKQEKERLGKSQGIASS